MRATFSVTTQRLERPGADSSEGDPLQVDTRALDPWREVIEAGGWTTALTEAVDAGPGLAVSDPRTGCNGVIVAGPGRADVVLSGSDEGALRGAVEDLVNVMSANGRHSPGESAEWDAGGRLRARGRVRVLSTAGLYSYAARHGAPLVLWVITLALALVSVLIAAAVGENSSQGWFADWAHATLDRVFTGALGAALVASVMAGRQLQRGSGRRRRQALVHWTELEGAPR